MFFLANLTNFSENLFIGKFQATAFVWHSDFKKVTGSGLQICKLHKNIHSIAFLEVSNVLAHNFLEIATAVFTLSESIKEDVWGVETSQKQSPGRDLQ